MKTFILSLLLITFFSLNLYCQVNWEKHPDNPVLAPGSAWEWEEGFYEPNSVIFFDDTYHMWYTGRWGNLRVGYATSPDGLTWKKVSIIPVLGTGPEGEWDDSWVVAGPVLVIDSVFHMWYTGNDGTNYKYVIGHATSLDGITWMKDTNNPVLGLGAEGKWDDANVAAGSVVFDGSKFHMWYEAWNGNNNELRIGHATSPDGVTWTKNPLYPVLTYESGKWDYPSVLGPTVIFDGTTYHMWYYGGNFYPTWNFQIGYATSENGTKWTKHANNPVLMKGSAGSWDSKFVRACSVIDSAGVKYKMWYTGGNSSEKGSIGYAESSALENNSDTVNIPDTAFLNALIEEGVDTNGDTLISYGEAYAITSLDVSNSNENPRNITDMTGIEAFFFLEHLICGDNQLTSLDVSNNTRLKTLNCWANQLTDLDVPKNDGLVSLVCGYNQLSSLDVSGNTGLIRLECCGNQLTGLDVSNCNALTTLSCDNNQLYSVDMSNSTNLEYLSCGGNQLTSLDLSNKTSLEYLNCAGNFVMSLDLSNCTALTDLFCGGVMFSSLDVSNNIALTRLVCSSSRLESLDVSKNTALTQLECVGNQLSSLDVSNCTLLADLNCCDNRITNLDISNNTALTDLDCSENQLSSLDVSSNVQLERLVCHDNQLTQLNLCINDTISYLLLEDMPTLDTVYVWKDFPNNVDFDTTGCPNMEFILCASTGIDERNLIGLSIFPNPANDLLTIETTNPEPHTIEIHSLNGQLIHRTKGEGPAFQVDLSSFQKGLYLITVRSRDYVRTEKIIKL